MANRGKVNLRNHPKYPSPNVHCKELAPPDPEMLGHLKVHARYIERDRRKDPRKRAVSYMMHGEEKTYGFPNSSDCLVFPVSFRRRNGKIFNKRVLVHHVAVFLGSKKGVWPKYNVSHKMIEDGSTKYQDKLNNDIKNLEYTRYPGPAWPFYEECPNDLARGVVTVRMWIHDSEMFNYLSHFFRDMRIFGKVRYKRMDIRRIDRARFPLYQQYIWPDYRIPPCSRGRNIYAIVMHFTDNSSSLMDIRAMIKETGRFNDLPPGWDEWGTGIQI